MTTYAFTPITAAQFADMVRDGSVQGMVSPFLAQYTTVTDAARQSNLDVRVLLAWTRSENRQATDISSDLLAAHNAAGIYYVGQSRATAGPIGPANEGGKPYCSFATWTDFWLTLADNITYVLNVAGGDLNRAAWYYTRGNPGLALADAGEQHPKATYYRQYLTAYPPEGDSTVANEVYGSDLIAYARTLIGQAFSTIETDPVNGVHPWAFWCESFAERVPEHLGLSIPHRGSATAKGHAYQAQGLLQTSGEPEHGAHVIFGPSFYAVDGDGDGFGDGHIGFWDKEKGMLLGTLTDGTGIGYRNWGMQTPGVMGWARVPGVAGETHPSTPVVPPPPPVYIQPSNPNGPVPLDEKLWARFDFLERYQTGLGYAQMGFAKAPAITLPDGRLAQRFQRGWFAVTTDADPWDVVALFPEEWPKAA
jgi:hypothetical protein